MRTLMNVLVLLPDEEAGAEILEEVGSELVPDGQRIAGPSASAAPVSTHRREVRWTMMQKKSTNQGTTRPL